MNEFVSDWLTVLGNGVLLILGVGYLVTVVAAIRAIRRMPKKEE